MDDVHVRRRAFTTVMRGTLPGDRLGALTAWLRTRPARPAHRQPARGAGASPRTTGAHEASAGLGAMHTLGAGRR